MMSRSIGGQTTWGSNGEKWANTIPAAGALAGTSWAAPAQTTTDLAARLLDDPATTQGTQINTVSSGALRFVVQALNPNAGTDSEWGTALWGTGKWSASVGKWEDISCRARMVKWTQGAPAPNTKSVVGVSTITLENLDGAVSPWAKSGHYVGDSSTSWIRSGLLVRFGVITTTALGAGLPALATFEPIYTGRIESISDFIDEDQIDAWIELTLTETTVDFGTASPTDQAVASTRVLTGAAFDAMVAAGWQYQTALVVPDEDAATCATTLQGGSSSQRIDLITDNLFWDWVADGRGRLELVRRHFAVADSGLTFANKPAVGQYPALNVVPFSNVERLLNTVTAQTVTGAPVVEEDTRSQEKFGAIINGYGFPRTDLILGSDVLVGTLGQRVVSYLAWDDLGIGSFDLNLDMDPVNLPALMTYIAAHAREGIGFTVVYTHPSGAVLTDHVVIQQQTHTVTPQGAPGTQMLWTCTLATGHAGVTVED